MSNDQDLSVFSDRKNIQQIYEELGCPPEFKHENVLYEFRNDRFFLTRFPADHPTKVFAIPDGVKEIESEAFRDCARLKLLTFPESVTEIAPDAFIDCPNLTLEVQEGSFALEYARKHAIRFAVV